MPSPPNDGGKFDTITTVTPKVHPEYQRASMQMLYDQPLLGNDQGTSPMNVPPALSNQNGVKRKVHTKKKKKGFITANVAGTKYEIIRIVIEEMTFHKARDDDEMANLIWNDSAVQHEKIAELRNYQRINHFPGMGEICRKDCLARNMAKMIKSQPQEYSFIPKTWIFPAECTQFQNYVKELKRKRKQKTFIVKPANGAMGHGISLIRNYEKLPVQDHFIVQEYLDKPFLMEGYKFDLRFYILVTSCDPLRVFLYNDGLVRMGTEKYHTPNESNLNQLYMHLTNYSVNKHNENFERDETVDKGSKRSIGWFTEFLRTNDYDVAKFWGDVSELVVKTLIVAEPHVLHAYRMCRPGQPPGSASVCFEVLGFDIILDRKLKPWLLESCRLCIYIPSPLSRNPRHTTNTAPITASSIHRFLAFVNAALKDAAVGRFGVPIPGAKATRNMARWRN
ncbi:Tubulin polyglutamylase TTLL7 [Anabarilius grahami]|uniref:Tubulin polyglutamylase TTLL7 n=1 Tax=Anabarilius grahami TaxID=495550 RepID=A0A3N0YLY5_ANAGA|nr:Tubulin polyglutamylase TTLL7 [Anabarilius grahami]